jgi:hypothetical protein
VVVMAGPNAHPFRRPTVCIPEQFCLAHNGNRRPRTARCRDCGGYSLTAPVMAET